MNEEQVDPTPVADLGREIAELRQVGDYMQSAASRVSTWVMENVDGAQIPYEESMAMRELASAIDMWTNSRRQSKPIS